MLAWLGRWIYTCWKALLIATAFAPALVVYGMLQLVDCRYASGAALMAAALALWAFCHWSLRRSVKRAPRLELRTTSVEVADNETVGFLLVYLLPLITRNLADYDWLAWSIVAAVFVFVIAGSYAYHFNPLLVCSGWHFYKVDTKERVRYLLISRDRILDAGAPRRVGRLTEYIFLDKGKP